MRLPRPSWPGLTRPSIFVLALLAASATANADDGAASMAIGGIVFTKNTAVRMASEDLYVSPHQVRVRFEFVNDTDHDVETVVAFPLPDIDIGNYWTVALGPRTNDPVNFVGFKVNVDNKPVRFQVEQRAFALHTKKDVTGLIVSSGLPVNMLVPGRYRDYERMLKAIPREKMQALIASDAIDPHWSGLPGYPNWIMRTRFYWTQVFPTHKTVVIAHSYQPISGGSVMPLDIIENYSTKPYCIRGDTMNAIRDKAGLLRRLIGNAELAQYNTQYVLKTAATWNGPIGRFRLTLDKMKSDNVLSLCWDGKLTKTGPTTYEFSAERFVPSRDIDLLVVE